MEALQFDSSQKVLSFQNLPKPIISAADEVIIEVAYAGLCGTDLHIIQGEFPCSKKPFVLGHEFSGIVGEVGEEVTHVKPGDRVALDPQSWCTTCENCTRGRYHLCSSGGVECATGIRVDGGWARYAKGRARQVYKLPSSLSLRQGALCEPMSCIVWGWERGVTKTPVGADILITGAGIIGNLWSATLHHLGHRKVTLVEPSHQRREINKRLETGFNVVSPQGLNKLLEMGERFDLVIECSGNGGAMEQGLDSLRAGGTLCVFGVAAPETQVKLSPYEIFKRELTIIGTIINPFAMKRAIGLMEGMSSRYLDYERLGIREYKLKDYKDAISSLKNGSVAKVMFQVNPDLE